MGDDVRERYPNLPDTSPLGQPLDWAWVRGARSEWGVRPEPGPRGLTMSDVAVGPYGEVPEHPAHRSMAPRGADIAPDTPDMGYILNRKPDVWAENTRELYEEAVARQWSATRDIPWSELEELPSDLEHAMCRVCTTLAELGPSERVDVAPWVHWDCMGELRELHPQDAALPR